MYEKRVSCFISTSCVSVNATLFIISDVKPKPVHSDQGASNGSSQAFDVDSKMSSEEPVATVTTMLSTVWFGAQSGRFVRTCLILFNTCISLPDLPT